MATIKAIQASSVHQIQSGQVIVDLNSVVKELVENSLDAGATSIEVRFKNNGLDSIEVQDNGQGIAPEDYESIALKHHTSKLSSYDDLDSLSTFGFRGEALSSLCALSDFHVVTATAGSAAKGSRLDFDVSGKLTGTSVMAAQKGTIVSVEKLFKNLPVRRKELEKNIKREYSKVLNFLQAYACISTNVRFSVSNQVPKGKKTLAFATKSNPSTRENIANVYGAKTLSALTALDLQLEMKPSTGTTSLNTNKQYAKSEAHNVHIEGHISKPILGEGRQAPDRQMFFVNSRPCALPQVSKAFNEVYKSFNMSQSPFVFANLVMDTNTYDVNVSPDKRTILLHDQTELLDSLKASLTTMFDAHDQTMPAAQLQTQKLPAFKQPTLLRNETSRGSTSDAELDAQPRTGSLAITGFIAANTEPQSPSALIHTEVEKDVGKRMTIQAPIGDKQEKRHSLSEAWIRDEVEVMENSPGKHMEPDRSAQAVPDALPFQTSQLGGLDLGNSLLSSLPSQPIEPPREVKDFNARLLSQQLKTPARPTRITTETVRLADDHSSNSEPSDDEESIRAVRPSSYKVSPGPVQNAFDRMRPKRTREEVATVTVGDQITTMVIGGPENKRRRIHTPKMSGKTKSNGSISGFVSSLKAFAAPGTQASEADEEGSDAEDDHPSQEEREHESDEGSEVDTEDTAGRDHLSEEEQLPSQAQSPDQGPFVEADESDDEYLDEDDKKAREEAKVAQLIKEAEETAAEPTEETLRRASQVFRSGPKRKDPTLNLTQTLSVTHDDLVGHTIPATQSISSPIVPDPVSSLDSPTAEAKLSLTISKSDFSLMRIIGQFNLGFILAVRPSTPTTKEAEPHLFIIDQHAADEKFNFERLSASTQLVAQRLVTPLPLALSAVEAELVAHNAASLEANGFEVDADHRLLTLPTSRETTFSPADLEELLHLLAEAPPGRSGGGIVRPSRVRRMLAMRACRASIMVGKALGQGRMEKVVRNMGGMERPWNCPHGRPTMRHLAGLGGWEGWDEGRVDWREYCA